MILEQSLRQPNSFADFKQTEMEKIQPDSKFQCSKHSLYSFLPAFRSSGAEAMLFSTTFEAGQLSTNLFSSFHTFFKNRYHHRNLNLLFFIASEECYNTQLNSFLSNSPQTHEFWIHSHIFFDIRNFTQVSTSSNARGNLVESYFSPQIGLYVSGDSGRLSNLDMVSLVSRVFSSNRVTLTTSSYERDGITGNDVSSWEKHLYDSASPLLSISSASKLRGSEGALAAAQPIFQPSSSTNSKKQVRPSKVAQLLISLDKEFLPTLNNRKSLKNFLQWQIRTSWITSDYNPSSVSLKYHIDSIALISSSSQFSRNVSSLFSSVKTSSNSIIYPGALAYPVSLSVFSSAVLHIFNSLNALDEHLHHSTWVYWLTSPHSFIPTSHVFGLFFALFAIPIFLGFHYFYFQEMDSPKDSNIIYRKRQTKPPVHSYASNIAAIAILYLVFFFYSILGIFIPKKHVLFLYVILIIIVTLILLRFLVIPSLFPFTWWTVTIWTSLSLIPVGLSIPSLGSLHLLLFIPFISVYHPFYAPKLPFIVLMIPLFLYSPLSQAFLWSKFLETTPTILLSTFNSSLGSICFIGCVTPSWLWMIINVWGILRKRSNSKFKIQKTVK